MWLEIEVKLKWLLTQCSVSRSAGCSWHQPGFPLLLILLLSACVTMSTSELQATDRQNAEELDTVKESISDIINQLQDIDPTRLSFSPFLDLDTQISLAPVSDSPESSVEELRSASHSISGSQRSLGPPPVKEQLRSESLLLYFFFLFSVSWSEQKKEN